MSNASMGPALLVPDRGGQGGRHGVVSVVGRHLFSILMYTVLYN